MGNKTNERDDRRGKARLAAIAGALLFACAPAHAQQAAPDDQPTGARVDHDTVEQSRREDIARELENPIGNLTVLPFENYTNFGFGPNKGTQNILEFEPVVPIHLNPDWTMINRAVIPVVWNPDLSPVKSVPQAFAATDYSAFLSPSHPFRRLDFGRRPDRSAPHRHQPDRRLQRLGPGPDRGCRPYKRHIVAGLLVNQVWSLGGVDSGPGGRRYATFLAEPFFNYNLGHGWFVDTAPIITDDESSGRKWTVPVGAVAGQIIKLGGKLPVKLSFGGYYNVVTPQYGARWQLQSVVAVIF